MERDDRQREISESGREKEREKRQREKTERETTDRERLET